MQILTLNDIKSHVRIDGEAEDNDLLFYGDSAEATIWDYLGYGYDTLVNDYGCVPAPLKHAALLLVAHFYKEREAAGQVTLSAVPYTFDMLLKPYVRLC